MSADVERVRTAILRTVEDEDAEVGHAIEAMIDLLAWLGVEHGLEFSIIQDLVEAMQEMEASEESGVVLQ